MSKKKEFKQENLDYRDSSKYRYIKSPDKKKGPSYITAISKGENWEKAKKYRMQWAKKGQSIYTLPFNTINEAHYIYYLDSLPTLKPYMTKLIREDMEHRYIKKEDTKTWNHIYDNNIGKKRMFSLKFSKQQDKDVLEFLENIKKEGMTKRAYFIALIDKDIKDKNFKFPKELNQYRDENKIVKDKLKDEFYKEVYYFMDATLKKGGTTFKTEDLKAYMAKRMPDLKSATYNGYWNLIFKDQGIVVNNKKGGRTYSIDVDKFNKLKNPVDMDVE